MEIALRNGAKWEFPLEMTDDQGAVDMTGKTLEFVIFDRKDAVIGRAATVGATGATGGSIAITGATLDVVIPTANRPALTIDGDFISAYGDLFDIGGTEPEWLGRAEFRVLSGPAP
jgi:hypothetical protein